MNDFVRDSQKWINTTYATVAGIPYVDEDGEVGWQTVFALIRALQHELGIHPLFDDFGPTTLSELTSQYGSITSTTTNHNIVAIMQCGMWCKGYWGGTEFGDFSDASDLSFMAADMGLPTTFALPPKAFKSLLSMDAYRLRPGGSITAMDVQRWLNGRYISRADYLLIPCDGLYSRDVQRGLMYAIQYELGLLDGVATGELGPTTRALLSSQGNFSLGAVDGSKKLIHLFQAALVFNRYAPGFSGAFDANTVSETSSFQSFAAISSTGSSNFQTWAALLVSTGDKSRPAIASDTSTPLTPSKAAALYSHGYRTVGRYLSVESKRIAPGELATIFAAGLTVFPIFQEENNRPEEFEESGEYQGVTATRRMRQLGFSSGAPIFFAVDFDPTDEEIDAYILPFFEDVRTAVNTSRTYTYSIGAYGTRNVCARLKAAGLVTHTFIAGMSWGWSGNLGFPLPDGWSYDQFAGDDVGAGLSYLEIDKVAKSPTAPEVSSAGVTPTPLLGSGTSLAFDELGSWRWAGLGYLMDRCSASVIGINSLFMKDMILLALQKPDFWYNPNDPAHSGEISFAWSAAYTPAPWTYASHAPLFRAQLEDAFDKFEAALGSADWERPEAGALGDLPHFAATFRGLINWGTTTTGVMGPGDCGGWALDLVRAWVRYEEARLAAPGGVLSVRTWMATNVGGSPSSEFGEDDLRADMAAMVGFFTGNNSEPLETTISRILTETYADPGWLATQFFAHRFGSSRATMVAAAIDIFNGSSWPIDYGITLFLSDTRRPGEVAPALSPSAAVRASELQDLAEGFADAIYAAMSW